MILYHGTTHKRAQQIFHDRVIKKNCERFFTKEDNGDGYSTDGYVYLTNEVTYALYFANCHHFVDKSDALVIFRVNIPDNQILPDYDEMRHHDPTGIARKKYKDDLNCSLLEFKTCRINTDISFNEYAVDYFYLDLDEVDDIAYLFANAGGNYAQVTNHYTRTQKNFIQSIQWTHV